MAYYKKPKDWVPLFGSNYRCDHPLYEWCTIYEQDGIGLAVIQQRYDPVTKHSWWSTIDPWVANDIYLNPNFYEYFKKNARNKDELGCYPTVFVRQIMRALGMPPLEKEFWETRF